ncbi:MAG TPA: phage minor head protein [Ottowia sp.]|nr:phage minor head protein [Ottowia sp.]
MADTPTPPNFRLGAVTPEEAIAAFIERQLLQPSFNWWDVWQDEHAAAFMVSGVAQRDVLQLVRERVDEALRTGQSLADFIKALQPALADKGWWGDVAITDPATGEQRITRFDPRRLQLILDTNLRQSQAAGRWAAAVRNQRRMPFLMYRTMRDERVRPLHAAWDGLVLPLEHPFWHTHYPPNGWRCRCRAIAVSERDVQRYRDDGFKISTQAPPVHMVRYQDKRTGLEAEVPAGIDPGFAYNAGQARLAELRKRGGA